MQGWVKLHRKIVDWEWYTDLPTYKLFTHLLITANHTDNKWRGETVKKGSLITSLASLSSQTGLSVQQVRTALKNLKKTGEILTQSTNKNTVVIVLNYECYQESDESVGKIGDTQNNTQSNTKPTSSQHTYNKQSTTNKNDNNDKNVNNDDNTITAAMSEFDWSRYSQKDMTEQYPFLPFNITVAEYDVLFRTIPECKLSKYIYKAGNYKNIRSAFDTIIAWAKEDGVI